MSRVGILFFCAFLISFTVSKDINIASLFTVCKRGDSTFNECLKNSIITALPKFVKGVRELNIPNLEPLQVEKGTIGEGTGTVHVVQNYYNLKLHNVLSGLDITEVEAQADDKQLTAIIKGQNPWFRMEADYDFNGRILILPIVGNGQSEIALKDITFQIFLQIDTFEKKGKKFGKVSNLTLTLTPNEAHYRFDNLFNGDKRLGEQMNTILNDNWKEVFLDVGQGYSDLVASVLASYIDFVFKNIEYDKLFLP